MKACGIVVEYNPLHNGHIYHIQKAKEISKCDILIAVMSSNFVQRGEPAIIDKKSRVIESLKQGIDIVIELPFMYTVENADIFAKYAVSILNKMKVESICFGSETGETKDFMEKYENSSILLPHLDFLVSDLMNEGFSYPKAMSLALEEIDSYKLEQPNDILGLSYYKTIKLNNYPIKIHTIKRTNDYKSLTIDSNIASATAIREYVRNNKDVKEYTPMYKRLSEGSLVFLEDFFEILKYKIISSSNEELRSIHLVNEGIENLFKKKIEEAENMEDFIKKCTSKRYTFARIKRTIVHIICNTKKEFANEVLSKDVSFIRLLGVNSKGKEYIASIRKDMEVPIISKFKAKSFKLLKHEKTITYIYSSLLKEEKNKYYEEEHYIFPIII